MYKGFLKFFGKISHILRENSPKWPYLDIEFMDVATTQWDFEKKLTLLLDL
jgi:hypothetical protein